MKIANEKAAEIAKMQETGAIKCDAIERALEGYEKAQGGLKATESKSRRRKVRHAKKF